MIAKLFINRSPKKERRREYERMSPPRDERPRNRDDRGAHSRGSGGYEYREDRPPPQSHRDGGERNSDRYILSKLSAQIMFDFLLDCMNYPDLAY